MTPEGIYVRHSYPGDAIEVVVWRTGEEPVIRKITDKAAMALLADLAQALRANGR